MTADEATQIWQEYYALDAPSEADEFAFVEACEYLIQTSSSFYDVSDKAAMFNLGAFYYQKQNYELALKYYEMAFHSGVTFAAVELGYIWYYGRTGKVDYEKAFHYYSSVITTKNTSIPNLIAAYKVADMYKNGYYVAKDLQRYKSMIRSLYRTIKDEDDTRYPLPEIYKRLAEIEAGEKNLLTALSLYEQAKDFLAQRLSHNAFFGDLDSMDEIVCAYYALEPFEPDCFDFYDLFYLLKTPCTVQFFKGDTAYRVTAVQENAACVIQFGEVWYRTRRDFFLNACIDRVPLTVQYSALTEFEVLSWKN